MIARRRRCPRSQLETCSGHSLSRETSGPRPPEPFATFERGEQFGEELLLKIYANHVNVMHREDPWKSITWSPNIHYLTSSSRCGSKKVADWQSWEIRRAAIGLINSTNLGIALTPHHVVRPPPRSLHSLPRIFLGTLVSDQLWQNTTLEHLFWFETIPVQYFDCQSAKKWISGSRPPQIAWHSPILSTSPPSNFESLIFSGWHLWAQSVKRKRAAGPGSIILKTALNSLVVMLWKAPGVKLLSYRSKGFKVTWWTCVSWLIIMFSKHVCYDFFSRRDWCRIKYCFESSGWEGECFQSAGRGFHLFRILHVLPDLQITPYSPI